MMHQATVSHIQSPCFPHLFAYWDCLIALICSSSVGKEAKAQCGSDFTTSKTEVPSIFSTSLQPNNAA